MERDRGVLRGRGRQNPDIHGSNSTNLGINKSKKIISHKMGAYDCVVVAAKPEKVQDGLSTCKREREGEEEGNWFDLVATRDLGEWRLVAKLTRHVLPPHQCGRLPCILFIPLSLCRLPRPQKAPRTFLPTWPVITTNNREFT